MAHFTLLELCLLPFASRIDWVPRIPSTQFQHSRRQYYHQHDLLSNFTGCSIFISYILAALAATTAILLSLRASYRGSPKDRQNTLWSGHDAWPLRFWTSLALTSFTVLSWNMVMVLATSYLDWTARHPHLTAASSFLSNLWQWVTTSSLFTEFALGLFDDEIGYDSVFCYLIGTSFACIIIGVQGQARRIPHLWIYAVLAEILPTSFVFSLFQIALRVEQTNLMPSDTTVEEHAAGTLVAERTARSAKAQSESWARSAMALSPWLITEAGLRFLPKYVATDVNRLMALVVLIRLSLAVPFLVACKSKRTIKLTVQVSAAFVSAVGLRIYRLDQFDAVWSAIIGTNPSLSQNYAASTLLRDSVLLWIAFAASYAAKY